MFTVNIVNEKGFNIDLVQRQGPQGPSNVSEQTNTNINGVLVGDSGKIRAATNAEIITENELNSALSPYLTAAIAADTYVPRAGGTMTGNLVVPSVVLGGVDGPRLDRLGSTVRARSNDGLSAAPFSAGAVTASGITATTNDFIISRLDGTSQVRLLGGTSSSLALTGAGLLNIVASSAVVNAGSNFAAEFISSSVSDTQVVVRNTSTGGRTWSLVTGGQNGGSGTPTGHFAIRDATAGANRFGINVSGNAAIGTTPISDIALTLSDTPVAALRMLATGGSGSWVQMRSAFSTTNPDWIFSNSNVGEIFRLSNDGRMSLGTTALGARLQVRGTGNTSATNTARFENSDGSAVFTVRDDGVIRVGNSVNSPLLFGFNDTSYTSSSVSGRGLAIFGGNNVVNGSHIGIGGDTFSMTSGVNNLVVIGNTFSPASGTATYASINVSPTINQTGGANGIARGIFLSPTITAAADWRSFDTNINTGFAYHSSGTAPSRFGGNIFIGSGSITPVARLQIRGSGATSATTSLIVEDSAGQNWLSARDDRMFNITGTQSFNNGGNISPSSGGDGFSSSQLCGLRFRSTLTLSDINSEFFFRNANGNRSFTSSFGSLMEFAGGFAPTSGTGTYSIARITGTINQTGGANGITQGVLVAPTLTAAADWRSFDTNVNTGFAYHSSGTAPSRFAGPLTAGIATFISTDNTASTVIGQFLANNQTLGTALYYDAVGVISNLANADYSILAKGTGNTWIGTSVAGQGIRVRAADVSNTIWFGNRTAAITADTGQAIRIGQTSSTTNVLNITTTNGATTIGGTANLYKLALVGAAVGTVYYGVNTSSIAANDIMYYAMASNAVTGGLNGFDLSANCTGNFGNAIRNNNSTSTSANARLSVITNGANAGDPAIEWTISGVLNWAAGIDNSDSDSWVLSANTTLGTNNALRIDTSLNARFTGHITSAFQSLSTDPSTIDIPEGSNRIVKNTTSGEIRDWVNDGGIMKKSHVYN